MIWLGWLLCLLWLGAWFQLIPFLRCRHLELLAGTGDPPEGFPRVSLIVPACNEEEEIEAGLRSLLDLDYPDFELIAVNDRSTDKTGAIINRLAAANPKLKPLHISNLPAGWLGKNHAMQRAADCATGQLLLFTDGDVRHEPETLKQAVRALYRLKLDHLTLVPRGLHEGYWERAFKTFILFALLLYVRVDKVPTDSPRFYVGLGSFNLVRCKAYDAIGGHGAFRLNVVDDLELGARLKRAGYRQDVLLAENYLSLRWHAGVAALIKGFEKNMFASLQFSLPKTFGASLAFSIYLAPYLGPWLLPQPAGWGFIASLLLMHGLLGYMGHRSKAGWTVQFPLPLLALLELAALWNSTFKTLQRGGVLWRGTFYSIKELKKALNTPPPD